MTSVVAARPVLMSALRSRLDVADGTMAFRFDKPPGWVFTAGQYLDMTLLTPIEADGGGNTRSFSIASGPDEDTLMVATRVRDTAFKRVLTTMPIGTAVKIDGPHGDLTLPDDASRPLVLLAGGIGITPFRSMIVDAARRQTPHRLFLFYSNRRPEDAPFLDELQALEQDNPRFTLIATMTEMTTSHRRWPGETGLIDHAMLYRHVSGTLSPVYYLAGPPRMVKGMHAMLARQSVSDGDMHAEEFSGY